MNPQLKIRLVSFGYGLASIFGTALIAVLLSEQFRTLIFENLGDTFWSGLIMVIIPEIVKAIRNAAKLGKLGARSDDDFLI
jgi:energy-coupling factor transporter transmembrane protein EcfT